MPDKWLRFKRWRELQDFSALSAWLLYDYGVSRLPDAAKQHLVFLLAVAAQTGGIIPNDPRHLAQRIGATSELSLQDYVTAGIMEEVGEEEARQVIENVLVSRLPVTGKEVTGNITGGKPGPLDQGTHLGTGRVVKPTRSPGKDRPSNSPIVPLSSQNGATPEPAPTGKSLVRQRLEDRHAGLVPAALNDLMREADLMHGVEVMREYWAGVVFAYWGKLTNHPNARADKDRLNRIIKRLKQAERAEVSDPVERMTQAASMLLYTVKGALKDDFLMGKTANSQRKYDGVETVFRDYPQAERLAELGGWKPGMVHPIADRYGPKPQPPEAPSDPTA